MKHPDTQVLGFFLFRVPTWAHARAILRIPLYLCNGVNCGPVQETQVLRSERLERCSPVIRAGRVIHLLWSVQKLMSECINGALNTLWRLKVAMMQERPRQSNSATMSCKLSVECINGALTGVSETESTNKTCVLELGRHVPDEYTLVLRKVLRGHKHAVTALHLTSNLKHVILVII
ncbi:BEACH domain-containing protein [Artemisia annua]|uniref:BEACH domain-containing protein n=1 Tax=Artemisia annua TaxID=35608 RepID=A0A2U1P5S9_ARTAN|nr:BEACH domain-containing protein [Artemisia annua]